MLLLQWTLQWQKWLYNHHYQLHCVERIDKCTIIFTLNFTIGREEICSLAILKNTQENLAWSQMRKMNRYTPLQKALRKTQIKESTWTHIHVSNEIKLAYNSSNNVSYSTIAVKYTNGKSEELNTSNLRFHV